VGIALRRRADAPYMRRWQYLLPCQQLSTKNDDTLDVGQRHIQIFVVSRAVRKLTHYWQTSSLDDAVKSCYKLRFWVRISLRLRRQAIPQPMHADLWRSSLSSRYGCARKAVLGQVL